MLFEKCIVDASIWPGSICCCWVVCSAISILVCAIACCDRFFVCCPHSRLAWLSSALVGDGVWGVFVGVVVSVLGRSVDALVPGADEGRGRPR